MSYSIALPYLLREALTEFVNSAKCFPTPKALDLTVDAGDPHSGPLVLQSQLDSLYVLDATPDWRRAAT